MKIGAHISSAGGINNIFDRAEEIEAEAIQMFISGRTNWRDPVVKEEALVKYQKIKNSSKIPLFFHGIYLINLATQDSSHLEKSKSSLANYTKWAGKLGVSGTIFHLGSHKGVGFQAMEKQICSALVEVLEESDTDTKLIIENSAGGGNTIGSSFAEIGSIINHCGKHSRIGVCLDTCHLFAAGYDISTRKGCELVMEEFEKEVGIERLLAVHANDSKTPLGSGRDRHENIGDGYLGYDGFKAIMSHPAFSQVPFLLEVPGLQKEGPDLENILRLKRIRDEVAQL